MKTVTKEQLIKWGACSDFLKWWESNCQKLATIEQIKKLSNESPDKNWAIWLLAHVLDRKNKIRFAVFSAEQVLPIFEKTRPSDNRPREAIEAAKKVIKYDSQKNRIAAALAADAADVTLMEKIINYGIKLLEKQ